MALLTRDYWDRPRTKWSEVIASTEDAGTSAPPPSRATSTDDASRSVPCTDGKAAEKIAQLREAATLLNEMGFHDAARVLRTEILLRARALRRLTIYRSGGDPWS